MCNRRHPDWHVKPEIMIPLVGEVKELAYVKSIVVKTATELLEKSDIKIDYKVGTMIEIPRAALTADEIAKEAEFFSFGTNDLTQMTFGFSRDDAGNFLSHYYDKKIYEQDPFARLDQVGVGKLIEMAAKLGRQTRPDINWASAASTAEIPLRLSSATERAELCLLLSLPCSDRRLAAAQARSNIPANLGNQPAGSR
jgi:pyruvate,orthophosphate dikinase